MVSISEFSPWSRIKISLINDSEIPVLGWNYPATCVQHLLLQKLIFYKQLQPQICRLQTYSSGFFLVLDQVTVQSPLALQQITVQVPFQFQSRLQFRVLSSSRVGYSSGSFLVLELVTVRGPFYFQIKLQFRVLFQFQNKLKLRSI